MVEAQIHSSKGREGCGGPVGKVRRVVNDVTTNGWSHNADRGLSSGGGGDELQEGDGGTSWEPKMSCSLCLSELPSGDERKHLFVPGDDIQSRLFSAR